MRERLGDPRVVPSFRCTFFPGMPSPATPGNPTPSVPDSDVGMAFAANRPARHSQRSRNPFHAGGEFRGYLVRTIATACQVACPPVRIRPTLGRPTRAFTSRLSTGRSPSLLLDITTTASGLLLLAGLSPARTAASFAALIRSPRKGTAREGRQDFLPHHSSSPAWAASLTE